MTQFTLPHKFPLIYFNYLGWINESKNISEIKKRYTLEIGRSSIKVYSIKYRKWPIKGTNQTAFTRTKVFRLIVPAAYQTKINKSKNKSLACKFFRKISKFRQKVLSKFITKRSDKIPSLLSLSLYLDQRSVLTERL